MPKKFVVIEQISRDRSQSPSFNQPFETTHGVALSKYPEAQNEPVRPYEGRVHQETAVPTVARFGRRWPGGPARLLQRLGIPPKQ